jgi:hypothetical protein
MENLIIYICISIGIKFIFDHLYPRSDVYCYHGKFENGISKGISQGGFWDWLFTIYYLQTNKFGTPTKIYEPMVPHYRVFHVLIGLTYWTASWFYFYNRFPWWIAVIDVIVGVLLGAWHFMKYERKFYKLINDDLKNAELINKIMYWLKRWWFSGRYFFRKRFTVKAFNISVTIGTIIEYSTTGIFIIYYLIKGV